MNSNGDVKKLLKKKLVELFYNKSEKMNFLQFNVFIVDDSLRTFDYKMHLNVIN